MKRFAVIMLGAESRLESRLERLKSIMKNPQSELNMATLLVSEHDGPSGGVYLTQVLA